MKRRAFLGITATLPLTASLSAAETVQSAIVDAEKAWAKAVVESDTGALEKIFTEDLIYGHSSGVVEDKETYLRMLKSGTKYEVVDYESIEVRSHDPAAAAAHCKVRMKGVTASGPFEGTMLMLHVWFRRSGGWQLAAHQTCRLP